MPTSSMGLPFVWYDTIDKQYFNRSACKGDCCYKLVTPAERLLPFQFKSTRFDENASKDFWGIYTTDGTLVQDLSNDMFQLSIFGVGGWGYCLYKGDIGFLGANVPFNCGFYYSKLTLNGEDFYSEVFFIPYGSPGFNQFNGDQYMTIEFSNSCDVSDVIFQTGWVGRFYIEAEMEKCGHEIYEEGNEDGLKQFHPTFQKYIHTLRFDEFCPDYMVAALVKLQMYGSVSVVEKRSDYLNPTAVQNIKTTVTWEENGCNAIVEVKMNSEEVFYKSGCCSNLSLRIGTAAERHGEFNKDDYSSAEYF